MVRQFKLPAGPSSVNAANYYSSVTHAIATLIFRSVGVPKEVVQVMHLTIEKMKYFLTTAYGDSKKSEVARSG